jgi:hypothetical protein
MKSAKRNMHGNCNSDMPKVRMKVKISSKNQALIEGIKRIGGVIYAIIK